MPIVCSGGHRPCSKIEWSLTLGLRVPDLTLGEYYSTGPDPAERYLWTLVAAATQRLLARPADSRLMLHPVL